MAKQLDQVPVISEGDVEMLAVDFTDWLDSGELLTGTPTVAEQTTSDLTISNVAVNTAALTVLGNTVAIGAGVQAKVIGQLAATGEYSVLITASTDASPARTVKRIAKFMVH